MWLENTCFYHNAATQWLIRGTNSSVRVLRQQPEREDSEMRLLYNLIFRNKWVVACRYWDVTKALYNSPHLPCPLLFSFHHLSGRIFDRWQGYTLEEARQGASGEEKKSQKPSSDRCPYSLL